MSTDLHRTLLICVTPTTETMKKDQALSRSFDFLASSVAALGFGSLLAKFRRCQ